MIGRISKKLVFKRPFLERGMASVVVAVLAEGMGIDNESDQVIEGHSVDALALRGDEGRGTLR